MYFPLDLFLDSDSQPLSVVSVCRPLELFRDDEAVSSKMFQFR